MGPTRNSLNQVFTALVADITLLKKQLHKNERSFVSFSRPPFVTINSDESHVVVAVIYSFIIFIIIIVISITGAVLLLLHCLS